LVSCELLFSIFSFSLELIGSFRTDRKHFIPLSSSYSELYNLQTFFTGFPPSLAGTRGNRTVPTTSLSKPSPIPALPPNEDGSDFHADTVLQEIAEAGSKWKKEHLRKEDMEVSRFYLPSLPIGTNVVSEFDSQCYVYRLMVEWANLVAPRSTGAAGEEIEA